MGLRYVKRNRMESLPKIPDATLASIGASDFNFEKFDEQLIFDLINAQLDIAQQRINSQ